ncbi:MAG: hypothetical protein KA586_05735 [Candidatus Promineofilum sp.]|nr:hypothetical protein [Promineifilum sp.]
MKPQRIMQVALVLALGLLSVRLANAPIRHNLAQLIALNAFSSRYATSRSVELLATALSLNCSGQHDCDPEASDSVKAVLVAAREQFIPDPTPMQIVDNSALISSDQFMPFGLPDSLQNVDAPGVLYGPGTLKLRLFLVSERESCWQIAVKAKHDDPPPVNLEVWLDKEKGGTLSYDRGDQTWEVLSLNLLIGPNLHILGITYANDYLEKETGADRNAYIEYVEITRLEDSYCEND